jgi:crotonobetainyl-CoA:carnitine CoA-transferase CaiB-like acyl-CoA transferase
MVVEVGPERLLGPPVKLSRTPAEVGAGGPPLGGDTDAVLTEAGYGADEIAALRDDGAVK